MANSNFTCVLDAWREGTTLYGRMHYYRSQTFTYTDTSFPDPTMDLGGTTYYDSGFGSRVRSGIQVGDVYSTTYSRTVDGTGTRTVTWTAGSGIRSDFAGTWSKDVGGFPGTTSPPTGLNVTNITPSQNSFTATVSISGWGTGSGTKYRELQVWTQGMVEPRRYQTQTGSSLSGTITTNNSSAGSLNIMPNTMYTIGGYASNGSQSTGSTNFGNKATLPPSSTITPMYVTDTAAIIAYSIHDQGGAKTMTLKRQLDSGSAVAVTTLTGSGAKSGTFVISGLAPGSTHTLTAEVSTDVGGVVSNTITFTTEVHSNITNPFSLYGAVSGATRRIVKLYGGNPSNNLFNLPSSLGEGYTRNNSNSFSTTYTKPASEATKFKELSYSLEPNTQYVLSTDITTSGTLFNNAGKVRLRKENEWTNTWDDNGVLSFTTGSTGTTSFGFYTYWNSGTGTGTSTILWDNIHLEKGSTPTEFKPYMGPQGALRIDKLYGSVNGKTKLVFGGC